jgi:hypothetical protein
VPTVYNQNAGSNDDTIPIISSLATFVYDGGDVRAPEQWGDVFIDCVPSAVAGLRGTLMSGGSPISNAAAITVASSSLRTRLPYSVNPNSPTATVVSFFMGLLLTWTDDYSLQSNPTVLYYWQPSYALQPTYETSWTTFGSSYGEKGFMHIRQLLVAYVSTSPVTITITTYDGENPPPIVLPSTGGQYQKRTFPVGPNKGTLFQFSVTGAQVFQLFEDDSEVWVGPWGRDGAYDVFRNFGGRPVDAGPI